MKHHFYNIIPLIKETLGKAVKDPISQICWVLDPLYTSLTTLHLAPNLVDVGSSWSLDM